MSTQDPSYIYQIHIIYISNYTLFDEKRTFYNIKIIKNSCCFKGAVGIISGDPLFTDEWIVPFITILFEIFKTFKTKLSATYNTGVYLLFHNIDQIKI